MEKLMKKLLTKGKEIQEITCLNILFSFLLSGTQMYWLGSSSSLRS